ncbi:MAG: Uncharacterized protein G01um101425_49 [Candidatus Peregrinibacteria bacterium Gr01-1014_25]|nr:MAG: Uncharacterized protein G01um101425_49 [Candidatus Peregrinibacteria bacterium Gr01-1014_25]
MHPLVQRWLPAVFTVVLVLWGAFTAIAYVGVPVHGAVLLSDSAQIAVNAACPETADSSQAGVMLCRGIRSLWPAFSYSVSRWFWSVENNAVHSLLWFFIASAILYACCIGYSILRHGTAHVRLVLSPLRIGLLSLGILWLLFTSMSLGSSESGPYRRIFEATPQMYTTSGTETLGALRENIDRLEQRGCLIFRGVTDNNTRVFDLRLPCMQTFFVTRVLPPILIVIALIFVALVIGRASLGLLRLRPETLLTEGVLSAGVGAGVLIAVLWTIAALGMFTATPVWLLLIAVLAALYRHGLYWLSALRRRFVIDVPWHDISLLLGWLLISYVAFNALTVVRPFPIGWDDLGVYLNKPRLIVSYGMLIPQMGSFQWEYLTALGFLLFGYDSILGATTAMMINWSEGLLAVLVLYAFVRRFLPKAALLACLLYYTLPLVGHFSFADMKIDNAVFAYGSLATFCVFLGMFGEREADDDARLPPRLRWLLVAGLLFGLALGIKITSSMFLFAAGAVVMGALLGSGGFVGSALLSLWLYIQQGQLRPLQIMERVYGTPPAWTDVISPALLIMGVGCVVLGFLSNRSALRSTAASVGVLAAAFIAAILPWFMYNNIASGDIILTRLLTSPPNTLTPVIDVTGTMKPDAKTYVLPPDLAVNPSSPTCQSTAKTEELDRYWGFGSGWSHYLLLPWRTVMNLDAVGYYVTTIPALLLFPLLLLLPGFWAGNRRWLRWLWCSAAFVIVQWIFLANGIPWYGVGMFFGLSVTLATLATLAPTAVARWTAGILLGFSLLLALGNREWQFDNMQNLYEYPLGKVSAEAMRERTIPHYDDIRDIVEERAVSIPDRPFVFRAGTFIPYFLPRNLERIPIADNQLEVFKCLYQERDPALTVRRLKALGFNSIIFDTNTNTIEQDPNGTLHQKVRAFVEFANDPRAGLKIVVNDPGNGIAFLLIP